MIISMWENTRKSNSWKNVQFYHLDTEFFIGFVKQCDFVIEQVTNLWNCANQYLLMLWKNSLEIRYFKKVFFNCLIENFYRQIERLCNG